MTPETLTDKLHARADEDRKEMFEWYAEQPNPLDGKKVVNVLV